MMGFLRLMMLAARARSNVYLGNSYNNAKSSRIRIWFWLLFSARIDLNLACVLSIGCDGYGIPSLYAHEVKSSNTSYG